MNECSGWTARIYSTIEDTFGCQRHKDSHCTTIISAQPSLASIGFIAKINHPLTITIY